MVFDRKGDSLTLAYVVDFWHYELGYVVYLVYNNFLTGHVDVDAIGVAEGRRDELEAAMEHSAMNACNSKPKMDIRGQQARVDTIKPQVFALLKLGRELVVPMRLLATSPDDMCCWCGVQSEEVMQ